MARRFGIFLLTAITPFLLRCGDGGDPSSARIRVDKLYVVSPHNENIRDEYGRAFGEYYFEKTGRNVEIVWLDQGGASEAEKYVRSRFALKSDSIDIDLFWGGGTEPYVKLAREGLLVPVELADGIRELLPPADFGINVADSEGRWYGTALSSFGILHNRRVIETMELKTPATWMDLADPALSGWVGLVDPRKSGSARMAYEIVLQALGWHDGLAAITKMGGNSKRFYNSASDVPQEVDRAEIAAGMAIDFYAYTQIARSGDMLGFVLPPGMTLVGADAIGMFRGAPHEAVARHFIEYVLSIPGQELLMLPPGAPGGPKKTALLRASVFPSVTERLAPGTVISDPFAFPAMQFDSGKADRRMVLMQDLIGALVIDNADLLRKAWRVIVADGRISTEEEDALCALPVTEEQALEMSDRWDDQVFRNKTVRDWKKFAVDKYGAILK